MRQSKLLVLVAIAAILIPCVAQEKKEGLQKRPNNYANEALKAEADKDYKEEIRKCREGLTAFPGNPDLREVLAQGLTGLGQYAEAEKIFKGLIESTDPADQAILVWSLGGYVNLLLKEGKIQEAEDTLQLFVEMVEKKRPPEIARN